jgi:hypothetical protein
MQFKPERVQQQDDYIKKDEQVGHVDEHASTSMVILSY